MRIGISVAGLLLLSLTQACGDDAQGTTNQAPTNQPSAGTGGALSGGAGGQNPGGSAGEGGTASAGQAGFAGAGGAPSACSPLAECTGVCVDLQGDPANCGTCGKPCEAGKTCVAGACGPASLPSCVDRDLGTIGSGVTISDSTKGRGNDVKGLCLRSGASEDMVFSWAPPISGHWEIFAESEVFDPVLAVRLATTIPGVCDGNELACNDDGGGGPNRALVSFDALQGQALFIVIDGFQQSGQGPFKLTFTLTEKGAPPKGACDNAKDVQIINSGLDLFVVDACYFGSCSQDPDLAGCVAACTQTNAPGLSSACAACYGDYAACVNASCEPGCLGNPEGCGECPWKSCGAAYQSCTGL